MPSPIHSLPGPRLSLPFSRSSRVAEGHYFFQTIWAEIFTPHPQLHPAFERLDFSYLHTDKANRSLVIFHNKLKNILQTGSGIGEGLAHIASLIFTIFHRGTSTKSLSKALFFFSVTNQDTNVSE